MRTYEILSAEGVPLHEQEVDDSLAPALVAGQTARLVAIDGERLAKASRVAVGPDAPPAPAVEDLVTEAAAAEQRAAAKAAREAASAERAAKAGPAQDEASGKDADGKDADAKN